jgi:hypothetical protein
MDDHVPTSVRSNELRFLVSEPTERDGSILAKLSEVPKRFRAEADRGLVEKLVDEEPDSPYLVWARLNLLWARGRDLERVCYPSAERRMSAEAECLEPVAKKQRYKQMAGEALASANWGIYRDMALEMADRFASHADDFETRRAIQHELLMRFSDSPIVGRMNEEHRFLPELRRELPRPRGR